MACSLFRNLRRVSHLSLLTLSSLNSPLLLSKICHSRVIASAIQPNYCCLIRNFSNGSVNLVISQGKAKFETYETDPPKKEKWVTKKRLKLQRKRDKKKRAAANKRDPRHLGITGKRKQKFANAEERIKYKLEKAQFKETMLIERLKRYEVPKAQGPVVKPNDLTGEERFYLKKMAQKGSNYAPVGRRGIFGGVILNMHMHWKKHETVKVFCKPCKPGQVQEYAREIARLSGGIPIQIIGNDTIIFYRGKNYVQPEVMSPIDTLSKKRALEKSKYEQSLECVRRFIAIANKELELYYRHVALYGDTNNRNPIKILGGPRKYANLLKENEEHQKRPSADSNVDGFASSLDMNIQLEDLQSLEAENDREDEDEDECDLEGESDLEDDHFCNDLDSRGEEEEESFHCVGNIPSVIFEMPSMFDGKQLEDSNNNKLK